MGDSNRGSDYGNHLRDSAAISVSGKVMFAAIILLFLTVVFVIFIHVYAKWLWRRNRGQSRRRFVFGPDRDSVLAPRQGLEPSVIRSLPVVIFHPSNFKDGLECAVCLSDVTEGEKARVLPKCSHGFHLDCINMWFQSHSTCPLCRNLVADDSLGAKLDDPEVRVPDVVSVDGHSTESPDFPTNVLFWGTQDQVSSGGSATVEEGSSSSPSSSLPLAKSGSKEALVIDIPRHLTDNFSFSSPSVRFSEEELKSPVTPTRMRSLRRLLSREKRVIPSSPARADIELGSNVQSIKAASDS